MGPGPGRSAALAALQSPAADSYLAPPSRCAAGLRAGAAASCPVPCSSRLLALGPPPPSLGPAPPAPRSRRARGVGLRAGPTPNWVAGVWRGEGREKRRGF
jgi:hypothetical protein